MPRSNLDQALVTGLTLTANHAITSLVQDSIAAGALALVAGVDADHDRRWGQTTLGLDLVATVGSLGSSDCSASDRVSRWPSRPPGPEPGSSGCPPGPRRSSVATRRLRADAGPAAAVPGRDPDDRHRHDGRRGPAPPARTTERRAAGRAAAGGRAQVVRDEPRRDRRRGRVQHGDAGGRRHRRRPGSAGRCPARRRSGVRSAGSRSSADSPRRRARERTSCSGGIERKEESFETAFDLPPPVREVSGSFESLVPFQTLSRQGRRFVWNLVRPDVIAAVMEEPRDRRRRSASTSASRVRRRRTSASLWRWPSSSAPARSNARG